MLSAVLARGVANPDDIAVAEINDERRTAIASQHGVRTTGDPAAVVGGSDVVLFAVKPQEFDAVAPSLKGSFVPGQVAASIMAGVPIAKIQRALGHPAVVRVMPNTLAAIGEAISVWTATPEVDAEGRARVSSLLSVLGQEIFVEDEKYLDMTTALSGSGPAYFFLFMEALEAAAHERGLPRDVAHQLTLETAFGAAQMAPISLSLDANSLRSLWMRWSALRLSAPGCLPGRTIMSKAAASTAAIVVSGMILTL